mgnify:CR=1 FL=1
MQFIVSEQEPNHVPFFNSQCQRIQVRKRGVNKRCFGKDDEYAVLPLQAIEAGQRFIR